MNNQPNLTPEMIQAILTNQENDPQLLGMIRKQKMADAMRTGSMTPVAPIQAGRQILPNYGGAISQVMQGVMANKMQPEIDQGLTAANARHAGSRQAYLEALRAAMNKQVPQQPVSSGGGMDY